jgi:hypothetical protein
MLLRSELLGCQCPSPISPDKAAQLDQMRATGSPGKRMLRFKARARGGGAAGRDAPRRRGRAAPRAGTGRWLGRGPWAGRAHAAGAVRASAVAWRAFVPNPACAAA